jgi:translation initiation factor 1
VRALTESLSGDFDFNAALKELDKSETHLVIRVEFRRWGKPVTIVQGLPKTGRSLDEVAHRLKGRLATGGTAKEGVIMLQGDHRTRIKDELVKMGFAEDHIEIY